MEKNDHLVFLACKECTLLYFLLLVFFIYSTLIISSWFEGECFADTGDDDEDSRGGGRRSFSPGNDSIDSSTTSR